MAQLVIEIRHSAEVTAALRNIGRQAPFALSLALNRTANEAQREIRRGLSAFTLRRKEFIERTIYRGAGDKATKASPFASVRVNPARDVLAQHEEGGQKAAKFGTNVAIPLPAVRQLAGSPVIPRRLRPQGLRMNEKVRKVVTPNGTFIVRNVLGKGRGRLHGARSEFLYRLKTSVPLRPRLGFHRSAMKAINSHWSRLAFEAIDEAVTTAMK